MTQTNIQWRRLAGIMAVQSSITLGWVIYSLYLPDLLVQLGFAKTLAATLLMIEHGLEALIEPIFGHLSDRSQRLRGSRFPWIILGVVLTSAFFLGLPMVVLFVPSGTIWRWIFPVTAVLWASAMAIFRSPVVALLGKVTPVPTLPIASSCLTLVQQLVKAFRFSAFGLILSLGPLFAFAIGSFVILGAATFLRQVMPPSTPQPESKSPAPISTGTVALVVGTAIAIGCGLRFLFGCLPLIFTAEFGEGQVSSGMLVFSLLLAFTALPAGKFASKIGNGRAMIAGLLFTAIFLGAIASNAPTIVLVLAGILISFAVSIVFNSMVPFVLELVPGERSGLGIGTFFGASGGASTFFDLVFSGFTDLGAKAGLGAIFFIVASVFVFISQKYRLQGDR